MTPKMEESQASFNGWAKVEVMGHQSHVGFVKTEAYGAAVLFRIDTPPLPEREYVLTSPAYAEWNGSRSYCPAGTKVKRPEAPGSTVLVGAGSIYRIIPCSEAVALRAIDELARAPLMCVELPEPKALAAGASDMQTSMLDQEEEVCDDCGKSDNDCRCSDFV